MAYRLLPRLLGEDVALRLSGGMKAETKKCCEIAIQPSVALVACSALPFLDLLEGQLLVLVLRGVQGRAGVAAVEIGVAFRLAAVVLQLQVQRRRHRRGAEVGHVMAHVDHVVAALEGEGLGQRTPPCSASAPAALVAAVQRARTGARHERRVVVRQHAGRGRGQAGLAR
jgi:hypothetical protein